MRVLSAVLLGSAILASPMLAQKPDFSGNWKLNTEKSDPAPQMGGGGGGNGGRGMGRATDVYITQSDSKIILEEKTGDQKRLLTYYLDGRESKNPAMQNNEAVSKSHWDGGSLITEGDNTFTTPMGEMRVQSKVVRTLSDDGKSMTVQSTLVTPRGERSIKLVYDKA